MCNYSGYATATRDAVKGDNLEVHHGGFFEPANHAMAVCLKPGTEVAFDEPVRHCGSYRYSHHEWTEPPTGFKQQVAISSIRGPESLDTLEFADGTVMLLSNLIAGQRARVLQLPATGIVGEASVVRDLELT